MSLKYHGLLFVVVLLITVAVTNVSTHKEVPVAAPPVVASDSVSFYGASLSGTQAPTVRHASVRNWDVLDPELLLQGALVQSLDDQFPFYHYNTYKVWPVASLTKLLTSVVVLEEVGASAKITVTARAAAAKGSTAGLQEGEVYLAEELLKIMMLSSANDAAIAFEDHVGFNEFVRLMNRKARILGMDRSVFHDGSGLSDLNQSTANDLLRLARYAVSKHPSVLQWTRMPTFLVQPLNGVATRVIDNVNPLVLNADFLGGKTGTSRAALQNLIGVFSFRGQRVVVVVLGSWNRAADSVSLLDWMEEAYSL
jgi:D-alanyl-D-alanine carboxypeptidase